MVLSKVPVLTLPFAEPAPVPLVISCLLLLSQLTVVLHGADTPEATKGCVSHPATGAGTASACPDAVQTEEMRELERRMLELINQERADPAHLAETRGRARPLQWDEQLAEVARVHSREMAARSHVSHFSPDRSFAALRVSQAGISYSAAAENVAKFRNVFRAHAAFMGETPLGHNHRSTILDPDFTHVGIGIVRGSDEMYYITQEFIEKP